MKILVKVAIAMLLLHFSLTANAQKFGAGGSLIYNPQSEGFGFGLRGSLYPNNNLSIVPQISFFPSFNIVHEYTLGLGLEYKFIRKDSWYIYAIGHLGYNSWSNYAESPMVDAKKSNLNLEGGIGISTWSCLRPFLEYRYNAIFKETNLQLGLLYVFKCKGKSNPGLKTGGRSRRKGSCAGYGNY